MSEEAVPVTVSIMGKEYRVACQPQEQEDLIESSRLLDRRMREIRQTGRVIGTDRIAVIAALNITHELIQLQQNRQDVSEETDKRLHALQQKIADSLATQHQLDARDESV